MVSKKTAVELFGYGSAAILGIKTLELSPLSTYLGNVWYYWFGLTVIFVLATPYVANKFNGGA